MIPSPRRTEKLRLMRNYDYFIILEEKINFLQMNSYHEVP